MVSRDSAIDTSLALIGGARIRASEEQRARFARRTVAGAAVAIVHILFVLLLVISGRMAEGARNALPKELVLLLPELQKSRPQPLPLPPLDLSRPVPQSPAVTITQPPPPPSTTQKPGDVLEAIGRELACGAGSYEKLSQAQREACRRQPWKFKKNAKGVIVLDVAPRPQEDDSISGNDAEIRTLQTSDPCLAAGNSHSECIHKDIFGR